MVRAHILKQDHAILRSDDVQRITKTKVEE